MFPEYIFPVLIVVMLFISFVLLALFSDLSESAKSIKRSFMGHQRTVTQSLERINVVYRLTEYTVELIQRTGITLYNAWLHFGLCIAAGILSFNWASNKISLFPALAFAGLMVLTPYAALKLIGDMMAERERKYSIDFLIILGNFLKSSSKHDIFEAFENVIPYVVQPIKLHLENMVFEYKHKINPVTCLEKLKNKITTPELRLYIENISICYIQGGDMEGLTQAYIEEMALLDDEADKQNAEDQLLNYGLYMLLAMNFGVILWTMKGTYKQDIVGSTIGQIIFVLDMVISMYIIYMTLRRG